MQGGPPSIPTSASEHPASWKFDFPIYHPPDLTAWRAWLAANHDTARGVWVASWRKASGRDPVAYVDLVEEGRRWPPLAGLKPLLRRSLTNASARPSTLRCRRRG